MAGQGLVAVLLLPAIAALPAKENVVSCSTHGDLYKRLSLLYRIYHQSNKHSEMRDLSRDRMRRRDTRDRRREAPSGLGATASSAAAPTSTSATGTTCRFRRSSGCPPTAKTATGSEGRGKTATPTTSSVSLYVPEYVVLYLLSSGE